MKPLAGQMGHAAHLLRVHQNCRALFLEGAEFPDNGY